MRVPKLLGEPVALILPRFNKTVFSQQFERPDGSLYEFITFGYTRPESAVIIFPLTQNKEVVAIRQYRHGSKSVILELPGGLKRSDEGVAAIARKELMEETGYEAESVEHLNPNPIIIDPCNYPITFDVVAARGCQKVAEPDPEETEFVEVELVPLPLWCAEIKAGQIMDAKSIVVTHLALSSLNLL